MFVMGRSGIMYPAKISYDLQRELLIGYGLEHAQGDSHEGREEGDEKCLDGKLGWENLDADKDERNNAYACVPDGLA